MNEAVQEVLAAHRAEWWTDEYVVELIGCSCGYATSGSGEERRADHEAHQASALAAAGVLR